MSVDGRTYPLEPPFLVIATQNAEERYGTYPLPESQMDRFLLRIRIDYPSPDDERRILLESPGRPEDALARLEPVLSVAEVRALQEAAERVAPVGRAGRLHRRGRARDAPVAAPVAGRLAARPAGLAKRGPRRGAGRRPRLRAARRPQVAGGTGARPPAGAVVAGRGADAVAQRRRAGAGGHHRPPPRARMMTRARRRVAAARSDEAPAADARRLVVPGGDAARGRRRHRRGHQPLLPDVRDDGLPARRAASCCRSWASPGCACAACCRRPSTRARRT